MSRLIYFLLKDGEGRNLFGDQTFNLKTSLGAICTSDARAMDFYYQLEHIPSGTMEVCATIKTFSQISTPETICISVAGKNISNPTLNNHIVDLGLSYCHYLFSLEHIKMYLQKVQNN